MTKVQCNMWNGSTCGSRDQLFFAAVASPVAPCPRVVAETLVIGLLPSSNNRVLPHDVHTAQNTNRPQYLNGC